MVTYGCESWTIKKAKRWRIDAFELWYWRRLLSIPWTAGRSNQSILKKISPGCSLEGLMLKLKLQYFGHLMGRTDIWKDPDAGRNLGQEEKGMTEDETAGWHHRLDAHEFEWTPGVGDGQGGLACCNSWGRKESDMTERLNWTDWLLGEAKVACKHICGCKEKEMATDSSILAWEIPWTEKPGGLTVHGVTKSQTRLSNWAHTFYLYERLKQQANTFVDAKKKARKEKKSND